MNTFNCRLSYLLRLGLCLALGTSFFALFTWTQESIFHRPTYLRERNVKIFKVGEPGSTNDFDPSTNDFDPRTNDSVPSTNDFDPRTNDSVPSTNDFDPRTNDSVPSTNNSDPKQGNNDSRIKNACILPVLKLNDPIMYKFFRLYQPHDCRKNHQDLVFIDNGTLFFSKPISSDTKCSMYPLIRKTGDTGFRFGEPVGIIANNTPLITEIFKIKCSEGNQTIYENLHIGVHSNDTLKRRIRPAKLPSDGLQLSVAMLGFDSMSRLSWLRRVPKSRDYLVNKMGAIELEGYGIMGDGTPAALFPLLAGKPEKELPNARVGHKGAVHPDDFPWIWKDFQKNGYVTSWAESITKVGVFNPQLLGFKRSPTDYCMSPFYLADKKGYTNFTSGCQGQWRHHQVFFNFLKELFKMYRTDPKFFFHFYDKLSHNDNNPITQADDDILELLQFLHQGGYLEDTLFVMFADHGSRVSKVRTTLSGKLEERMPYFSLSFPKWFQTKHPDIIRNLKINVKRLTTPLDVHETLKDILHFGGTGLGNAEERGISLFKEIPKSRTCKMADIAPHWCTCMSWSKVPNDDEGARQAVQAAVDYINEFTREFRTHCAILKTKEIISAHISGLGNELLHFRESSGFRCSVPVLSDNTKPEKLLYQVIFVTSPSNGKFEVTLERNLIKNLFTLNLRSISRVNLYGDAPNCVLDKKSELRPYCYCQNKDSAKNEDQ